MSNRWVTLTIVPQLGGRLMQVRFGDHDYLWVNERLKGQYFPPAVSAAQRTWFNYGGDKIWPMPEGNDDEQHWAGAVGSVLDGGEYSFEVLSQGETCAVRMVSPPDPQVGLTYTREIAIGADSPEIRFNAIMTNVTGHPLRWSAQSVSQYDVTDPKNPAELNRDFWGFTPANPQSAYLNGYHVRTGSASNAAYRVRDGLFTLHYGERSGGEPGGAEQGGEVWIDSPDEWVAVLDGGTGYAMIERFHYDRTAEYPGKATVIFYSTGIPRTPRTTPPADAPPRPPIYYVEAEINSPMILLAPGERYGLRTEWYPTRLGRTLETATYAGAVGEPLTASATPQGLSLAGEFGVFFAGQLVTHFYDRQGLRIGSAPVAGVTPLQPVRLAATVQAPAQTARVSLHLIDPRGVDRGPLGEVMVIPLASPRPR